MTGIAGKVSFTANEVVNTLTKPIDRIAQSLNFAMSFEGGDVQRTTAVLASPDRRLATGSRASLPRAQLQSRLVDG